MKSNENTPAKLITLSSPIGYPPVSQIENKADLAALPIIELRPCIPNFTFGTAVYRLKECFLPGQGTEKTPSYIDMLQKIDSTNFMLPVSKVVFSQADGIKHEL